MVHSDQIMRIRYAVKTCYAHPMILIHLDFCSQTLMVQNQELNEEVLRLHQENLHMSRSVSPIAMVLGNIPTDRRLDFTLPRLGFVRALSGSEMRAARNVAKVQVALETTTREFLRGAGDKIRCELAEELDFKTRWVNVIPDWIIVNKQCM